MYCRLTRVFPRPLSFGSPKEAGMKRVLGTTFVFGIALMGTLIAQAGSKPAAQGSMAKTSITTEAEYSAAMKEIGSTNGMLGKAIQSASAADAAKASARLETLFNDVH